MSVIDENINIHESVSTDLSQPDSVDFRQPLENVFLEIMKQLSDEQKSPIEIAKNIVERTARLVRSEICTWFQVTPDRQKLVLVAAYGTKAKILPTEQIYNLTWETKKDEDIEGLTAWLAVRGEEFSANSFRQLCAHRSHKGAWDKQVWGHRPTSELKAWFGVPLKLSEEREPKETVIGVLKVERSKEGPFSEHDKYVVRLMAKYIAITLEYRNTITAQFLKQVSHPLWGAMKTIINILKEARINCDDVKQAKTENKRKYRIEELKEIIDAGLIQAQFVNQSMTAIKKLVLNTDTENLSLAARKKKKIDLVLIVNEIILNLQDLADAQSRTFADAGSFTISFDTTYKKMNINLTEAEEDAVRNIITELLYNSLKHSRIGGKAIVYLTEDPEFLNLEIRDYGKGIKKNDIPNIFDEGFRKSAPFAPEGVGFGLSMINALTQRLGWPLPEVITQNTGVSFIVKIPYLKEK